MAVTFDLAPGAEATARKFIDTLVGVGDAVRSMGSEISKFDANGDVLTRTFRAVTQNGKTVEVVLREQAGAFELVSAKSDGLTSALKRQGTFFISLAGTVRLFEAQVIKRLTGSFQSAIVESISNASRFSVQIAEIETISQKASVTTEQWANGVRRLSAEFGNSQADVAEGLYQLISNQIASGSEAVDAMRSSLEFAKATVSSAADSVNLLSSAIKSFNLPASDADKVAASFFKTIELGRVRAKDMADTFGRIGPTASEAGVSLNEVQAAITVLTTKGTKFSDAATLISNIILKLVRPTEEMKKLFQEWGVASGPAAISTFGFAGVLQKLDQEAQKGTNRIGELFNQIRAMRGVIGLTGASFDDFNTALSNISNATDEYQNAIKKVTESTGDKLKRQLNEAKIAFEESFGTPIVESVTKAITYIGGLAPIIKTVATAASELGKVLAYSAVAATAYGTAFGLLNLSSVTASISKATEAILGMNAAIRATTLITGVGLALGIGYAAGQYFWSEDNYDKLKRFRAELEKTAAVKFENFNQSVASNNTRDLADSLKVAYKAASQELQRFQASNVQAADRNKEKAIQAFKETTERTKVAGKNVLDSMNNGIKQLREGIEKARTIIRESFNAQEQLQRKLGDSIFDSRLKYASDGFMGESGFIVDEQKTTLIKARLQEITNLARSKFREGTKESVDDARRLYGEAEKLTGDLFDANEKKRRAEFESAVRRGMVTPSGVEVDSTGNLKARYDYTVSTIPLEQQLRNIANERVAAEEALRAEKEAQIKLDEKAVAAERERVRTVTQALELIAKIRVFNDKGEKVQDPARAVAEFERQAQTARSAAAQSSFAERLQLEQVLAQQKQALIAETNAFERSASVRAQQEETAILEKKFNDNITKTLERYSALSAQLKIATKEASDALTATGRVAFNPPTFLEARRGDGISDFDIAKFQTAANSIKLLQDATARSEKKFIEQQDLASLQEYSTRMTSLLEEMKNFNSRRGEFGLEIDPASVTAIRQLESSFTGLLEKFGNRNQSEAELKSLSAGVLDMGDNIRSALQQFDRMGPVSQAQAEVVNSNFDSITAKIEKLTAAARIMNMELSGQRFLLPDFTSPVEGNYFGKVPQYYAGGFVPRGSDVKPAMLGVDEAVITGQGTKAWAPLLRAINAGLRPSQMSGGSTTNIGDIHMNIQGGDTSKETLGEVAKGLRRMARRGRFSL